MSTQNPHGYVKTVLAKVPMGGRSSWTRRPATFTPWSRGEVPAPGEARVPHTLLELTPVVYASQVEGTERSVGWALPISTTLDMRHRALLTACARGDDPFAEYELLTFLLEELPSRVERPGVSDRAQTLAAHRKLAAKTQVALANDGT